MLIVGALMFMACSCHKDHRHVTQLRPPVLYGVQSPSTDPGEDSSLFAVLPSTVDSILYDLDRKVLRRYPAKGMNRAQHRDVNVPSVADMLEILRERGNDFASDGPVESKFIGLCYHWSLLATSVLRSKGHICRVRCGFAPYLGRDQMGVDHTIIELWNPAEENWQLIDPEVITLKPDETVQLLHISSPIDPFHISHSQFHLAATAWMNYRSRSVPECYYGLVGTEPSYGFVRTSLIRDWLNILGEEHSVSFGPDIDVPDGMNEGIFLDSVAKLMIEPDKNFDALKELSARID